MTTRTRVRSKDTNRNGSTIKTLTVQLTWWELDCSRSGIVRTSVRVTETGTARLAD